MPRTQREYALRYAEHVSNDLERALYNLEQLTSMYPEGHPNYDKYNTIFVAIAGQVAQAKEFVDTVRKNVM